MASLHECLESGSESDIDKNLENPDDDDFNPQELEASEDEKNLSTCKEIVNPPTIPTRKTIKCARNKGKQSTNKGEKLSKRQKTTAAAQPGKRRSSRLKMTEISSSIKSIENMPLDNFMKLVEE